MRIRNRLTAATSFWELQFVTLAAIWGSSFVFIKVLGRHWPAVWVALGRVAFGAAALLVLLLVRRERLPHDRRGWLHCAVAAFLFNALPWTLLAFGEQHTSSIVAGLWNATTPLWVLMVSLVVFGAERPTRSRLTGLAMGFAGVALLLGPWRSFGGGQATGYLACAGAAVCYGFAFPYTRRYLGDRPETGVALSACQLLCATAMLSLVAPVARAPTVHIGLDGAGSLLALGVLGSGIAFAINYSLVRSRGATAASTVTYLIPVFSTALGATVLGEPLHWNQAVGAGVLLLGIAISQDRVRAPGRRQVEIPVAAERAPGSSVVSEAFSERATSSASSSPRRV